jgi:DNA recombination protein RmuC
MFIVVLLCIVNIILAGIVLCKMFAKSGTPEIDLPALKEHLSGLNADEFARNREELNKNFASFRQENMQYFNGQQELIKNSFGDFIRSLQEFQQYLQKINEDTGRQLTGTLQNFGDRSDLKIKQLIETLEGQILQFKNAVLEENRNSRQEQLAFQSRFQESVNSQLAQNRDNVDARLKDIQESNSKKLDEMKKTVDDKLQESMEKHFNESFKLISERLEQVHKGLGEMQTLAVGVGDLRKVLTNVKVRGNIGEIQLAALLEQYLSPDQYEKNRSIVPNSKELVEFAIRLPGHKEEKPVFLPIDSKFPVEDYLRLMECYEQNSSMSNEVKMAQKSFAQTVKKCAADIKAKYIYPPVSTAFALMFVPSEGIYAEILRQPGLFESLQNDYQISVVGPSNLVAFLNSLQMGFKTLAIEKHSNEVWQILGAVKTEFSKFGTAMDATRKSLEAVVNHVDKIGIRSRAVERKLRSVQELSEDESAKYFSADDLEQTGV